MEITREQVAADTLQLLRELADDWEYGGRVEMGTYLIADMQLESLGVVILSSAVEEHYGTSLPFAEFFSRIGARGQQDITVSEWVDFVHASLTSVGDPGGFSPNGAGGSS